MFAVPIANCWAVSIPDDLDPDAIVEAWSVLAAVPSDEMTVNVISGRQGGKRYAVMAWLYLPSIWSAEDTTRLGEGLAAALGETFSVEPSAVQVVISIVAPGSVVEAGQSLHW